MPSKDEKCEKHSVLSISASTWLKKVDDSCRAASQPIPLFCMAMEAIELDVKHDDLPIESGDSL